MKLSDPSNLEGRTGMTGFSILELLISVTVMAIIFVAVFSGVSSTFNLMTTARENLRATQIMVSRLEGIRLCAWGSGQLFNTNIVPTTFTESFYPLGLNTTTNNGTVYGGTLTITTNPAISPAASYAPNLAKVTVTVTWTNGAANVHQRTMTSYVAQYGEQNYVYSH
jgi:type II secretory pathway pseudopilin PulG